MCGWRSCVEVNVVPKSFVTAANTLHCSALYKRVVFSGSEGQTRTSLTVLVALQMREIGHILDASTITLA